MSKNEAERFGGALLAKFSNVTSMRTGGGSATKEAGASCSNDNRDRKYWSRDDINDRTRRTATGKAEKVA